MVSRFSAGDSTEMHKTGFRQLTEIGIRVQSPYVYMGRPNFRGPACARSICRDCLSPQADIGSAT